VTWFAGKLAWRLRWLRARLVRFRAAGPKSGVSWRSRIRGARRIALGPGTDVQGRAELDAVRGGKGTITLGARCRIDSGAMVIAQGGNIVLGDDCSVNAYAVLYGHGGLTIGSDVRIAAHVVIIPANHVFQSKATPIRAQGETRLGISVGDDVWIGAGAIILDGVAVGKGSVIGAGAVVTCDVPPGAVVAGNPARPIRLR
jgi:acetyltransferase-like isoleucine patch superfamily enzyme